MTDDHRFDVQPNVGNHFAWLRTQIALERTLLAGVRTGVSLIGFGFTVAQFFAKMQSHLPEGVRDIRQDVPRDLGLTLIAAGVLSLAIFTWQYHLMSIVLRSGDYAAIAGTAPRRANLPSYLVSFVVILIGIAAFASIFLRF